MEKRKQMLSSIIPSCESAEHLSGNFEEKVQRTNDEASDLKASAVALGYWKDPFISCFVTPSSDRQRTAEMHRGCFVRVKGIEVVVHQFLSVYGREGQVVNLGAGYDTLYWKLRRNSVALGCFVEVDFDEVVHRKKALLEKHSAVFNDDDGNVVESVPIAATESKSEIHTGDYYVQFAGTYFCCTNIDIVGMRSHVSHPTRMRKFAGLLGTGNDNFMNIFESNMERRGIPVPGLKNFKDDASLRSLLATAGWQKVIHWRADDVFECCIPSESRQRIEKIEFLDEPFLLSQLLHHYVFVIASRGRCTQTEINFECRKSTSPPFSNFFDS
uniref:Leucine carboxyl methyltransferase 1 n=1 Tax=Trichuris muris TaxID=70415 RepID=A0A5S6R363_TRIMR